MSPRREGDGDDVTSKKHKHESYILEKVHLPKKLHKETSVDFEDYGIGSSNNDCSIFSFKLSSSFDNTAICRKSWEN